jgi:aryl-alcohol dehydrogenase-like predicted oxidoreductase
MEFSKIGATDCAISRLGFGCAAASNYDYGPLDEAAWIDAVKAAVDAGINFFDVAGVYGFGYAEHLLSRALGNRRHHIVIATKGGLKWDGVRHVTRDASQQQILQGIEDSLRRLRLDVIPLYQLHWPDPRTPLAETLEALGRAQRAGKIRYIGVSNFSVESMQEAQWKLSIDSLQVPYSLLCRDIEDGILSWCQTNETSVLAHSGLARGLLTGKRPLGSPFQANDTRARSSYFSDEGRPQKQRLLSALELLSKSTGRSVSSISLRWILDEPRVSSVLVGIKNRIQLEENIQALGWRLGASDREILCTLADACPRGLSGTPVHAAAGK